MGDDVVVAVEAGVVASLRAKFEAVLPHLDERQQRLVMAGEARSLGHGGIAAVARLLHEQGFSLQGNAKTIEGGQHPDRDAQFSYLNDQAGQHLTAGDPVISVDTKKKELVGPYKNGGKEWHPAGDPEQVKVHDFIDPTVGKANPYGVYDLGADTGWVSVGTD